MNSFDRFFLLKLFHVLLGPNFFFKKKIGSQESRGKGASSLEPHWLHPWLRDIDESQRGGGGGIRRVQPTVGNRQRRACTNALLAETHCFAPTSISKQQPWSETIPEK